MAAIYTVWYNFIKMHKTLKMTPAMAAGMSKTLWSMDDLCGKMDKVAPKHGPRGHYKKRPTDERSFSNRISNRPDLLCSPSIAP
ncbi:hypothetical protein [Mesorhizobium sp. WSM3626]|uniref:hypothetical protein n=1 Tax=Mesorhizobium sp. WSM3626 TaxID=1040987 RepID=UPI0018DB9D60|nr:hypothetical protein [Mesorhizobium sp. WSM3626]